MWCFNEGILFIYYSLINSLIFDRYSYMSTNIGLVSDRMKSWLCSIVDVDSWRPNKHAMIPVILLGNALPGADASSVHCNVNSLRTKNRQAPGCAQNLRHSDSGGFVFTHRQGKSRLQITEIQVVNMSFLQRVFGLGRSSVILECLKVVLILPRTESSRDKW